MSFASFPVGAGRAAASSLSEGRSDAEIISNLYKQVLHLRAQIDNDVTGKELQALRTEHAALQVKHEALERENAELKRQLSQPAQASQSLACTPPNASTTSSSQAENCPTSTGTSKLRPEDLDFTYLTGAQRECQIAATEDRGIFPCQLRRLLEFLGLHTHGDSDLLCGWYDLRRDLDLHVSNIDLYQLVDWVIRPSTKAESCSFVEAISQDPSSQKPSWYVSHWWGGPVADSIQCVEAHKSLRGLPDTTAYWIFAFATNLCRSEQEILSDPSQTSFFKAMKSCAGILSILDKDAVAFTRAWCMYEVSITLSELSEKLHDLATVTSEGRVAMLSSGFTAQDEEEGQLLEFSEAGGAVAAKAAREQHFPVGILAKALKVKLEEGEATREVDRRRILNTIIGSADLLSEPPSSHSHYSQANKALHWRFAVSCYEQAFAYGRVDERGLRGTERPSGIAMESCEELAHIFADEGKYDIAVRCYEKALETRLEALGPKHPDVGSTYNEIARMSRAQGQNEKALELYDKALIIRLEALGPKHRKVGVTYNEMAVVYASQSLHEKALEFYEKSLAILLEALGPKHRKVGVTYNEMAVVCGDLGLNEKALEFYEKGLAILLEALGPKHRKVGDAYSNIALLYDTMAENEKALGSYERALVALIEALGPKHPNVGDTYNNMAAVYGKQGQQDKALEFYEKALATLLEALGPKHVDVGATCSNMAVLYASQGLHEKALEFHEKSLVIRLEGLGPKHRKVGATYSNMAMVYGDMAEHEKALECYEKALAILPEAMGSNHRKVGDTYSNMAVVYSNLGQNRDAVELFSKAADVYESCYGLDHPETVDARQRAAALQV